MRYDADKKKCVENREGRAAIEQLVGQSARDLPRSQTPLRNFLICNANPLDLENNRYSKPLHSKIV